MSERGLTRVEASSSSVAAEMREYYAPILDRVKSTPTHYDGCWKDHFPCAVIRLLDECDRLQPPPSDDPRGVLKWVFERSREGCFSRKRSERDAALAEINRRTEKFS
jgi:hypothetical protein